VIRTRRLSVLCCGVLAGSVFAAQTIVTVAGGGPVRGEGTATAVSLFNPSGVAVDAAGNLYIGDADNYRVCRVDAAGQLTVYAGSGASGFLDGPAAEAQFSAAADVTLDASGNLYVADTFSSRVRKIDALTREVTTVAGGGDRKEDNANALEHGFEYVVGVTYDGKGGLYICDAGEHLVLRLDLATGILRKIAGLSQSGFSGDGGPAISAALNEPRRAAVDAAGNLLICDTSNHRIRRVDTVSGSITTYAGTGEDNFGGDGGPAVAAQLNFPTCAVVDADGNVLIMDADNYRVRRVDKAGIISTIVGTGFDGFAGDGADVFKATFNFSLGIAVDAAKSIYIADTYNNRIRKIGSDLTSTYDSDADAFPDHVEAAALTNPQSAASTPFSNAPLNRFDGHALDGLSVKLNFGSGGNDTIQIAGRLPIPDGFSVPLQPVIVDVGGIAVAFSLDARGHSTPKGDHSFKLNVKTKDGLSKYSCKLSKGSYAAKLAALNFSNTAVKNAFLAIPVTVYYGETSFTHTAFLTYSAKPGKSGQGKTGRAVFRPGETSAAPVLNGR